MKMTIIMNMHHETDTGEHNGTTTYETKTIRSQLMQYKIKGYKSRDSKANPLNCEEDFIT